MATLEEQIAAAQAKIQAVLDAAQAVLGAATEAQAAVKAITPPAPKTVLDYGARADGAVLANAAFAKAALSGDILVPAGRYLLDPTSPILLQDGCTMQLDPNAVLLAKPNAAPKYHLFKVVGNDVTIRGGQMYGDRDSHDYSSGGTHEWGYGILVSGLRCAIENVITDGFTGDGVGISGDYCTVRRLISRRNRRQGMSVFDCRGLRVYDSVFMDTAGAQNGPCAGVDFEPDAGSVVDAVFENCVAVRNRAGFLGWIRSGVAGNIDATFINCSTDDNANGFSGKGLAGKVNFKIRGGTQNNRSAGARIDAGCTMDIAGCTFSFVDKTRTEVTKDGIVTKYDIQVLTGGVAIVGTNTYK